MRIIAGKHRGRLLQPPADLSVRPTADKARQALFNMLQHRGAVTEAVVLDAFCGTGALALESLSQGATLALFMDQSPASLALAEANAALLKETSSCRFFLRNALDPGKRPHNVPAATLLFLDPPYKQTLALRALRSLQIGGWLAASCLAAVETEKDADLPLPPGSLWLTEKIYGESKLTLLTVKGGKELIDDQRRPEDETIDDKRQE